MIKEKHIAARKHQKTFHMEYKLKRLASELYSRSFNNKYSCAVEIKSVQNVSISYKDYSWSVQN